MASFRPSRSANSIDSDHRILSALSSALIGLGVGAEPSAGAGVGAVLSAVAGVNECSIEGSTSDALVKSASNIEGAGVNEVPIGRLCGSL